MGKEGRRNTWRRKEERQGEREIIPVSIVIGASLLLTVATARNGPAPLGQIPKFRPHLPVAFPGRQKLPLQRTSSSPNGWLLRALDHTH